MSEKTIRIGLVDDHTLFREGLRDLLADQPDFEVVAEGNSGLDALSVGAIDGLDVLLIDLRMPKLGGVPAIRRIRVNRPDLKIVVVSMFEDEEHMRHAVAAGADAYHSKMDDVKSIVRTIRALMAGQVLVSADERRQHIDELYAQTGIGALVLSEKEHQVLEELARGDSNREIAARLAISEQTLKNHLSSVFRKLGVKTRLEAVRRGMERAMIAPPL